MKLFHLQFQYDGNLNTQERTIEATSAGHAQEKCRREYPGCKILDVWQNARWGTSGRCYGRTHYEVVSPIKPEPLPAVKAEETHFPFWDGCLGKRPILTVEERAQ